MRKKEVISGMLSFGFQFHLLQLCHLILLLEV